MFREAISTPIDPVSKEYIDKLKRPDGEPDLTLSMLGLACFKKKIPNYEGMTGCIVTSCIIEDQIQWIMDCCSTEPVDRPCFYYLTDKNFSSLASSDDEKLTSLGFNHKETVEKIVCSKISGAKTEILFNTKKNIALVLSNNLTLDHYHLILSFLPLYYPLIFTSPIRKEDPEFPVLCSLSKTISVDFKREISRALQDYKQEFLFALMAGLFRNTHTNKIAKAKISVDRARIEMENQLAEYSRRVELYKEAMTYYEGTLVMEQSTDQEQELIHYMCNNKAIRNINMQGSRLSFTVATTLKQFDLDTWESFARRGNIFDGQYGSVLPGAFSSIENRKLLFNAIFSEDPLFEVKMCGFYRIDIENNHISTDSGINYPRVDPIYTDYVPNPHLQQYACLGDFSRRIVRALNDGDMVTAIELCVHSAGCVNLDETDQNFRPLLGWILSRQEKILRRFDGEDMTPSEALLWLLEREKENRIETDHAE